MGNLRVIRVPKTPPPDLRKTALYRMFDVDGRLLYIGITVNPQQRFYGHHKTAEWFRFGEVDTIEIEWHADRAKALEAEAVAIWAENPIYNRQRDLPDKPKKHQRAGEVVTLADALKAL